MTTVPTVLDAASARPSLPFPSQTFARLTPCNNEAREAFHHVAHAILQDNLYIHHKEFMHIDDEKVFWTPTLDSPIPRHGDDGMTDSEATEFDTDLELEYQKEHRKKWPESIWTGHYKFDLSITPHNTEAGWILGKGRAEFLHPLKGVDFLLATERKPQLRGTHAHFLFDIDTGIFCLKAYYAKPYGVIIDGQTIAQTRVMLQNTHKIKIGPLEYDFSFTNFSQGEEGAFQRAKRWFFKESLGAQPPPPALSATPSQTDFKVAGWTITTALGSGHSGNVSAAYKRDGSVAAVKTLTRKPNMPTTETAIQREIATLTALKKLLEFEEIDRHIIQLVEVIFQFGHAEQNNNQPFEYVWILTQPIASGTWDNLAEKKLSSCQKEVLFKQVLGGVAFLHRHGWMHRDLKPSNLGITSGSPPQAVILDFGHAMRRPASGYMVSTPGVGGTISYLAPEMEMGLYTETVDVWALGVVGWELMFGCHPWDYARNPWNMNAPQVRELRALWISKYQSTTGLLQRCRSDTFDSLLGEMLRYSAELQRCSPKDNGTENQVKAMERISASAAFEHISLHDPPNDAPKKRRINLWGC